MKLLKFITAAVAVFAVIMPASAQFNIYEADKQDIRPKDYPTDSVKVLPIDNNYFSIAKHRAERRAIRKERNTVEFNAGLDLSQTQFENWAAGGDNTFAARATLFFHHQYNNKKFGLDYKVDARYGMNRIGKDMFKNEDEFTVNILTKWAINDKWSYAASGNLRSQFATGYVSRTDHTRKSTLMAPGFLDIAVGFTYVKSPWSIVLSPVGGSAVFVLDDELAAQGINGVDPGKRSLWKVGPSVRVNFDKEFYKKIFRLRSEFYIFTNIKNAPIVRWENTFYIRATKYLSTTLYAQLYYDKEAETPHRDQLQVKYSLSIGLAYNFKNK
jgi:hypothetical protein